MPSKSKSQQRAAGMALAAIAALGLSSGLQFSLDAGDSSSRLYWLAGWNVDIGANGLAGLFNLTRSRLSL